MGLERYPAAPEGFGGGTAAHFHHGIDWLCHYGADTALIDNPARKAARTQLKTAQAALVDAQCALAQLLGSQASVEEKNRAIPGAQTKIDKVERALTSARDKLKTIPAPAELTHLKQ